jgi:hypothetical protein
VELLDEDNRVLDQDRASDVRLVRYIKLTKDEEKATFDYAGRGIERVLTLNVDN